MRYKLNLLGVQGIIFFFMEGRKEGSEIHQFGTGFFCTPPNSIGS